MVLLISYDLRRPGQTYGPLYEAIRSYGTWWHHLESVWIIETQQTPNQVYENLRLYLDENDNILVVELKKNYWGRLPQKAWSWLAERGFG